VETPVLCITAAGSTHGETWEAKQKEVDVFFIKNILNGVAQLLGVPVVDADNGLLFLGTPSGKLIKQTDCKLPVVCAEIDWKKLAKKASKKGFKLQELPKYPTVKRDLSLVLPKSITFSQIEEIAFKAERKLLQHVQVFDTYEGKPLTEDQKSYSVAFYLYDNTKTMGESQIDGVMQKLITQFETQLNAVIRK
jgi:phenylalanyl-tRNA synthetase beta chain